MKGLKKISKTEEIMDGEGDDIIKDKDIIGIMKRQIIKYSSWFTLSVLLNQISMYLIYRLSDRAPDLSDFFVLTGMCTAGVWISTHVVAACHQHYPREAVIAALVAAGLLLFTADSFSSLSMRLMGYYGVGEHKTVNLLLTEKGIRIVRNLNLPYSKEEVACPYRNPPGDTSKVEIGQALCGVELLSKVGEEYLFEVNGQRFTLPKTEVEAIKR